MTKDQRIAVLERQVADLQSRVATLEHYVATPLRCNCSRYKHGELTCGWFCPIHGQQL